MFKVPDWEEDIPKNELNFQKNALKKTKNKNRKENDRPPQEILKQNSVVKPNFKTKIKLKNNAKVKVINNIKKSNIDIPSGTTAIENNNAKVKVINNIKKSNINVPSGTTALENNNESKEKKVKKKKQRPNNQHRKNLVHNLNASIDTEIIDADKTDELILNKKKAQLDKYKYENTEELLFKENSNGKKIQVQENKPPLIDGTIKKSKVERKKELLKSLLQKEGYRSHINASSGNALRDRMLERLKAAKFRYLNEKLYTSSGSEAQKLFQSDPNAFQTYHEGYQQQMKKWPVRPLDIIIKRIQKMPKTYKIADMGCGEAELSKGIQQNVRSFDLVSNSPNVEACDVAHTPLPAASIDVAVYCLALMGTDLTQYLVEANRVLRIGGHLLIAEVESRFDNVEEFSRDIQKLGFSLKKLDKTQKVFFFMEFTKAREPPVKKNKLPTLSLKPCIYKKR